MLFWLFLLEIQWHFSIFKSGILNLGQVIPRPRDNNLHLYINLHLYLSNCILFCNLSCFYWGRAKLSKFDCISALHMFICLCEFEIIQYILKYKCICICILSYYTYSGTEYSAYLSILPECLSVYVVAFPICTSPGGCS